MIIHHGFMDQCRSWDRVARLLATRWQVFIPDARGHGDSQWIGTGGTYYFPDYVYDLVSLRAKLGPERAVHVGHSLGGSVMAYHAAAFREQVRGLVIIEGLGPPPQAPTQARAHLRQFVETTRACLRKREPRPMGSLEEAATRLLYADPLIDEARASELAETSVRPVEGGWVWKLDPLHRARMGVPYVIEIARSLWRAIEAPVLYIRGAESRFVLPDERERLSYFSNLQEHTIDSAGHNVHSHAPDELAQVIAEFAATLPE